MAPTPTTAPPPRHLLLRALYLLIALGMGAQVWPVMFHHRPWEIMHGVANAMLAALTLLAALGVRYPLQMLPLMMFELLWKVIWCLAVPLPMWLAGTEFDAAMRENLFAIGLGLVIIPPVMPWRHVWATYFRQPAEPWQVARPGWARARRAG